MNKRNDQFSRRLYSSNSIKRIQAKIDLLGFNNGYSAITFMNARLFTSMIIFAIFLYFFKYGYIISPVATFLYYFFLPSVVIDRKVNRRKDILEGEAMYFFEVLSLSLESGRNLKVAIEITANNIDGELSREFKRAMEEVRYGKSLDEALIALELRIPSDTINNIILNIRESNIFGNSIIDTLHNQIDYLADKRIMETKAKISKIPLKISVISVVFFIPLLLLLILSPVILKYFS